MGEWLSRLLSGSSISALVWILVALAFLVVVFLIMRLLRGRRTRTYVAAARHRVPRLNVVDAVAVDEHRRLVLVRRDDVEHLILIGGPTDVVVEQAIVPHRGPQAATPPMQRARSAATPQARREPEMANVPAVEESAGPAPRVAAVDPAPRGREKPRRAAAPDNGERAQGDADVLNERAARAMERNWEKKGLDVSIEEEMSRLLEDLKRE